jgi:ribonuclease HI
MQQEYYAVKVGRLPGIYYTWSECENQINGYSHAYFKIFSTLKEARQFLGDSASIRTLIAYIGGARCDETLGVGVIYHNPDSLELISGVGTFSTKACHKIARWAPYFVGCYFCILQAIKENYQQLIICTNEPALKYWTRKDYGQYTYMTDRFKAMINKTKGIEIIFADGINYTKELPEKACELAENAAVSGTNPIYNPLISDHQEIFAEDNNLMFTGRKES